MNLADIKPYPKNAKKHPKAQIEQVAKSIKEFGFNQPLVVDKDNVIIVGHARFEAAQLLKLEEVPAIQVELDEKKANAYRLADNPPFMDEEKYSGAGNDIADKNFGNFGKKFTKLMQENYRVLKNGGLCTITINDRREKGFLIPIQSYVLEWARQANFRLWDFVVAEVLSQKIRLRKKDYGLKRTVKCQEYVITFKK